MAWIKLKDEAPTTDCKVDIVMYNGKREVDVNYDKQRNEFYKYKDALLPGIKTIFLVSYWQPVPILPSEGNTYNSENANCAIFDVSQQSELLKAFYAYIDDKWALGMLTDKVDEVIEGFEKSL